MTKFQFRLEAALRLRHLRVETETACLQELMTQHKRLEVALESLREERSQASRFIYEMRAPTAEDLRALSVFQLGAEARAAQLKEALRRSTSAVDAQKQRLLTAKRDELILSKLKGKQLKEWQLRFNKEIEATAQELWQLSHTTRAEDGESG